MSTTFRCGDHAALVGYLYDECERAERDAIAAHLAVCAACAAEMSALDSTRIQLASWSPPEAELGFVITRSETRLASPLSIPRLAWVAQPLPAWAQMAAAAAIFAVGLALGIAGPSVLTQRADSVARDVPGGDQEGRAAGVTVATLDALEERLRTEIAGLRASPSAPSAAPASAPATSDGLLLARVRALIDESERRQQRELALRTAQVLRDFDSQRRVDLEQIQRSFGQFEGLTGAEVREQRQMLNYLMRVSQQR
ncbi:MAG: hypothetical protein A3I61_09980 [Acidobacteria bacterium RIFCSPLOWO2_02_FULL_68_18]|nr:MAG: hypothetical protein A3I61_09980 [Acidobacteria bacterium RIFCSPLOWO2_02_FULL_68_18]OFW50969.1 MAG: hypothetical protein A3G77_15185 [Acidobacteria bacterium RIFCSPLOWO2_12_FULL_68_19]